MLSGMRWRTVLTTRAGCVFLCICKYLVVFVFVYYLHAYRYIYFCSIISNQASKCRRKPWEVVGSPDSFQVFSLRGRATVLQQIHQEFIFKVFEQGQVLDWPVQQLHNQGAWQPESERDQYAGSKSERICQEYVNDMFSVMDHINEI